jgi:hypothetical protein
VTCRAAVAVWGITALVGLTITVAWQYGAIFNPINPK